MKNLRLEWCMSMSDCVRLPEIVTGRVGMRTRWGILRLLILLHDLFSIRYSLTLGDECWSFAPFDAIILLISDWRWHLASPDSFLFNQCHFLWLACCVNCTFGHICWFWHMIRFYVVIFGNIIPVLSEFSWGQDRYWGRLERGLHSVQFSESWWRVCSDWRVDIRFEWL